MTDACRHNGIVSHKAAALCVADSIEPGDAVVLCIQYVAVLGVHRQPAHIDEECAAEHFARIKRRLLKGKEALRRLAEIPILMRIGKLVIVRDLRQYRTLDSRTIRCKRRREFLDAACLDEPGRLVQILARGI